jgi:hypothetical protein
MITGQLSLYYYVPMPPHFQYVSGSATRRTRIDKKAVEPYRVIKFGVILALNYRQQVVTRRHFRFETKNPALSG